jgi:hypothetical protein
MALAFIRALPIRVDTFFSKRSLGEDVDAHKGLNGVSCFVQQWSFATGHR